MIKRFLCLLTALALVLTAGCAGSSPEPTQPPALPETLPAETQPVSTTEPLVTAQEPEAAAPLPERHYGVAEPASAARVRGVTIERYTAPEPTAIYGVEPYTRYYQNTIIPGDLTGHLSLAYHLTVTDQAQFSGGIPDGYDLDALIQWGKYPGLNMDVLHRHGFTGQGAVVAYIDQALTVHPEYDQANVHYTNLSERRNSMHGPMALSLLCGETTGTAPDAEVYYYAHNAHFADQTSHAEALYAILEQNESLPQEERITMVGFSDQIDPQEANIQALREAVAVCEENGVMVFFCGDYAAVPFATMTDKNDYLNVGLVPHYGLASDLLVPAGGRSGAFTLASGTYIYWADGGLSWTMPYMLGLYAIATEIDPTLTKADLLSLANSTAYRNNGRRIVNPVGFIAEVLTSVGRDEEAQVLLDEAAYNRRYTYAIMNKRRMSAEDLAAVETYFARLTDTTVLVVEVKDGVSAQDLYRALQADAWERDGIVEGVQIFGTPDMVPSFSPDSQAQASDLFYGSFLHDPDFVSTPEQAVETTLCWSVARLPLVQGEYAAYFSEYHASLRENGVPAPEPAACRDFGVLAPKVNTVLAQTESDPTPFLNPYRSNATVESGDLHLFENTLGDMQLMVHCVSFELQEDGRYLYTVEFTGDPWLCTFVFNPPNGDLVRITGPVTDSTRQTFTFHISPSQLEQIDALTMNFFVDDSQRVFLQLPMP